MLFYNNKMATEELTKRFIEGLKHYELTPLLMKDYKYCGGDSKEHANYFELINKHRKFHQKKQHCICGQKISDNCYITNGIEILTLGNCCIKKFIDKSGRTCEKCDEPHKNRIVNRCNECRKVYCDDCGIKKSNPYYKKCYKCNQAQYY